MTILTYCIVGMPFVNPDGSAYKYMPGQPLPQPVHHYPQGGQPQVYQVQQQQQEWTTQISQVYTLFGLLCFSYKAFPYYILRPPPWLIG